MEVYGLGMRIKPLPVGVGGVGSDPLRTFLVLCAAGVVGYSTGESE